LIFGQVAPGSNARRRGEAGGRLVRD